MGGDMMLVLHLKGQIRAVVKDGCKDGDAVFAGHRQIMWGCPWEAVTVPEQDVAHLRDADGNWTGTLSDIRQYTAKEQTALDAPKLAREELAKTSEARSLEELAAQVALIRKVLVV